MASYSQLPSGLWRVQIARNGVRQSATFATKTAARQWAVQAEADMLAHKRGEVPRKTVAELLTRYAAEVSPTKKGARWEVLRLAAFKREPWAQIWAQDLSATPLAQWRDRRLLAITPGSVRRDITLLRAVFARARGEWRWLEHNPLAGFQTPAENKERTRRIGWREIRAILRALGYPGATKSAQVARLWLLGLRSGMRCGEMVGLQPADVDLAARVAHLTDTKNGDDRDVPLTRAAARLLDGWRGWSVGVRSVDALFRKARDRAGVRDLHFHDARAYALTSLAKRVDVLTLARISGHRDVNLLARVYYRVSAAQIAQQLG